MFLKYVRSSGHSSSFVNGFLNFQTRMIFLTFPPVSLLHHRLISRDGILCTYHSCLSCNVHNLGTKNQQRDDPTCQSCFVEPDPLHLSFFQPLLGTFDFFVGILPRITPRIVPMIKLLNYIWIRVIFRCK